MSDNIKVVVKVRPLIPREIDDQLTYNWMVKDNTLIQIDKNGKPLKDNFQQFTFDKVYDKDSDANALYDDIVKPIVAASLKGINGTIFAYGQTSSGKTYTMAGTKDVPGITQLAVHDLFNMIKNIPDRDFLLRVSYIELYNETINDLLDLTKMNIKVHDTLQGTKVDSTEKVTSTPEEMFNLMKEGEANRQIGATNMNEKSSRSHSIFQIIIESREHSDQGGEEGCVCVSQLNLVDLAGSERGGQSGATGKCLKESTHINKSLSTLALVIKQLSEESGCHTNYRDSKLTRILQNSLGGNSNTSIICAVTPASLDETISTLQFATRAKVVRNKPKVNEVHTSASMIQTLTKELAKMQSKLESAKNIKRDNVLLRNKIELLQRQILNGPRSTSHSDRRKTWCAPRRATISTLEPVPEHAVSLAKLSDFIPISDDMGPQRQVKITVNDEVIEIDSDEEIPSEPTEPCSPYHGCKESSKTPPCVLREKMRNAEKAYNDVVEMTKLEKICSPSIVELEQQLQNKTETITLLQDKVSMLTDESKAKDECICQLNTDIEKKDTEIQQMILAKDELLKKCESYDTTVAELEFSYDTLKKKSKSREDDLLSMLKERDNHSLIKSKTVDTTILVNFMDLSKDITLVNSDVENSIIENNDIQENILSQDMQLVLQNKICIIKELENEISEQKKQIYNLEISSGEINDICTNLNKKLKDFEGENTALKSTINTLNKTIKTQKDSIEGIQKDIASYNNVIHQLQLQLNEKEIKIDNQTTKSFLTIEENLITNNENIIKFVTSIENHIVKRDIEIKELKETIRNYNSLNDLNTEFKLKYEEKEKELNKLYSEQTYKEKDFQITNKNLNDQIIKLNNVIRDLQNENEHKQIKLNEQYETHNYILKLKALIIQSKNILIKISENYNSTIEIRDSDINFETLDNLLISIKSGITEEISKGCKALELNEELKIEISNLSEKNNNLLKLDEKRCQDFETLLQQYQQLNGELLELKLLMGTKSQENSCLQNQLTDKNCIISMLVEKDNKINEEIEKINDLLKLKDEKYQEIKLRLDNSISEIKNIHIKFRVKCDTLQETVKQRSEEICGLTNDLTMLREKFNGISVQIGALQNNLDEKNKMLESIYDKVYNLNIHDMSSNEVGSDFAVLPSLIDKCVKLLKSVELRDVHQKQFTEEQVVQLKNDNNLLEKKIIQLNNENKEFSKLIDKLKVEIKLKKEDYNNVTDIYNILKLDFEIIKKENEDNKECCQKLKSDVENKLLNVESKHSSLISDLVHNEVRKPSSLLTICHNKINDMICYVSQVESETYNIYDNDDKIKSEVCLTCKCNNKTFLQDYEILKNENLTLKTELNNLADTNIMLYTDLEESRRETGNLIELTKELNKVIKSHQTNLNMLTAINYAENNLLKFKMKAHLHHHSRLHNVCQRDIPEIKKQLVHLHTILENEPTLSAINNSFKRFSCPSVLPGNTSLSVKNESNMSLDGDLLMLDTNITMTTDNASTIYDETSFDVTQINVDNISSLTQENYTDKMPEPEMVNKVLDSTLVGCETCNNHSDFKIEHTNIIEELKLNLRKITDEKDECHAQCEMYLSKIQGYENNIKEMTIKISKIEQDQVEIKSKYQSVTLELCASKDKAKRNENDIDTKSKEIERLKQNITDKKKDIMRLEEENTTLSSNLMDYISEIDTLKKEVDDLKLNKTNKYNENESSLREVEVKLLTTLKEENTSETTINSLSHDKYCLLQNEISASREDCKGITEEIATIKTHLERNNPSLNQSMDLDDEIHDVQLSKFSVIESNSYNVEIKQISNQCGDCNIEKDQCLQFMTQKTGEDIDKLDKNIKILEIMKIFYDYIINKHGSEIENLSNQLTNMQETNNNLQLKINLLSVQNNEICKDIRDKDRIINEFSKVIQMLKSNIDEIRATFSNSNKHCDDVVNLFKDNILNVFDNEFSLSITPVYDLVISNIIAKNEKEITKIITQCSAEQGKMQNVYTELNLLRDQINEVKLQLSQKENDCNLLKAKEESLKQICNAVTLDLIARDNEIKNSINKGVQSLLKTGFIESIDLGLTAMDSINILFKYLIDKCNFEVLNIEKKSSENQKLTDQIQSASESLHKKDQQLMLMRQNVENINNKNEVLHSEIIEKEKQLSEQKFCHDKIMADFETKLEHLNNIIIKNLNEKVNSLQEANAKYEDIISKLNEHASIIQSKFESEGEQKIKELANKIEAVENENRQLREFNDVIVKEKDNCRLELKETELILKQRVMEYTKISTELCAIKESLLEKDTVIQQLKCDAEKLLVENERVKMENKEFAAKMEQVRKDFEKRGDEISQLQLNTKTLEKSAEIQNNIIKRIQKEKDDVTLALSKQEETIRQLTNEMSALRQSYDTSAEVKEARLECDHAVTVKSKPKRQSGSKAEELLTRNRERRRSIYDANRSLSSPSHEDMEAMFSNNDFGDVFPMKNDADSGRSTPNTHDSVTRSSSAQNWEEEQDNSSVSLNRLRRQRIHDMHRPALRNSMDNSIKKTNSARNSMEDRRRSNESESTLVRELESCRAEVAELRERCRELDEECEICAQHLEERNQRCYSLNAEKLALEARVKKMAEELRTCSSRVPRDVAKSHVAVNTDEDWANLHTVFVDRMSFDKEVDRNKQLTTALEEFHLRNRDLKASVCSLERKLRRETSSPEAVQLRQELDKSRKHVEQLTARCQEAEYLRARCDNLQEHIKELTASVARYKQTQEAGDRQGEKKSLEIAALKKQLEAVSKDRSRMADAGSAIVASQHISDVMRENKLLSRNNDKLLRLNAKLTQLCKRQGLRSDDDRENRQPNT